MCVCVCARAEREPAFSCSFPYTELKEVTEKVKDYCSLMKDFPLQDLLAANSLESIKAAIGAIFLHMRKIRNTSYPPGRVMHLLEAVSRDVLAQMTKVRMFASVVQAPACHACT